MMQSNEEYIQELGKGSYGTVDLIKYNNIDGSSFLSAVKTSYGDVYYALNKEIQILYEQREFIETCFARKHEDRGSAYELLLHRFLHREEEEEKKIVPVIAFDIAREGRSFLKLRLKGASKKPMEDLKKPIKFKISLSKPKRFKKFLKTLTHMKVMMPMKPSGSNLVYVQ